MTRNETSFPESSRNVENFHKTTANVSTENGFFASTSDLDSEGRLVYPF